MGLFSHSDLEIAQRNLYNALRNLRDVQKDCSKARTALENTGRFTQAKAIEMVCASVEQIEKDLTTWRELIGRSRENSNHSP